MDQHICFRPGVSPGLTSDRPPVEFDPVPSPVVTARIKACASDFPVLYAVGRAGSAVVERFVHELGGQFPTAHLAVTAAPIPGQSRRPRYRDPLTPFRKRVTTLWFVGRLGEPDFDLLIRLAGRWAGLGARIRLLALLPEDATTDDWDRAVAQLATIRDRYDLSVRDVVVEPDVLNAPHALLQALLSDAAAGRAESL